MLGTNYVVRLHVIYWLIMGLALVPLNCYHHGWPPSGPLISLFPEVTAAVLLLSGIAYVLRDFRTAGRLQRLVRIGYAAYSAEWLAILAADVLSRAANGYVRSLF